MKDIVIIAHRGNGPTSKLSALGSEFGGEVPPEYAPENTIKAFRKAVDQGANGIELDIYLSQDGVPMVIHDDELNINVRGVDRKARDLGKVSEKTREELKLYDIGQGERIPTLNQVIKLVAAKSKQQGRDIILNIELKDPSKSAAKATHDLVRGHIEKGNITHQSVIYCAFDHKPLERIREIDKDARIAPALKTAFLFGEENVDKAAGWIVKMEKSYREGAIAELQNMHDRLKPNAVDAVLWDIDEPLVAMAEKNKLELHASTSDFRNFENSAFLRSLIKMQERVQVYFKTDEPQKIMNMLHELRMEVDIDFSSPTFIENETKNIVPDKAIARLPKPGQMDAADENALRLEAGAGRDGEEVRHLKTHDNMQEGAAKHREKITIERMIESLGRGSTAAGESTVLGVLHPSATPSSPKGKSFGRS